MRLTRAVLLAVLLAMSASCAMLAQEDNSRPADLEGPIGVAVADGSPTETSPALAETAAAAAQVAPTSTPARVPASLPIVAEPTPADPFALPDLPEGSLSCQEFFTLLKTASPAPPSTVEQTLKAIKAAKPKYLSRTVYAYETMMAFDDAGFLYPRAIVYGGDGKLILNFSGSNKQKGFERIESICFNDAEAKFEFFEVVFPAEATSPEALADLTPEEKLSPSVVIPGGRGTRECAKCHESPSRPNWDTASLWPGFYGATDDSLRDHDRPDARPIYASLESEKWKRFQAGPLGRGRYAYTAQEWLRPNSDLTLRLSYLNGKRIVGDLKRLGSAFEPYKAEFAKALFCTPKAERHFFRQLNGDAVVNASFGVLSENADAETKEIFLASYYDEMQKERRLSAVLNEFSLPSPLPKEHFEEVRSYYRKLFKNDDLNLDLRLTRVDVDEVLLVRALKRVTDKLDLDMENWSMVRDGGYVHENGLGGNGRIALRLILQRPFAEAFLKEDAELFAALQQPVPDDAKICGLLERKPGTQPQ